LRAIERGPKGARSRCGDGRGRFRNPPRFLREPDQKVDGEDLPVPSRTVGLSCRLYETPEGPEKPPTDNMLRAAIGEHRDRTPGGELREACAVSRSAM